MKYMQVWRTLNRQAGADCKMIRHKKKKKKSHLWIKPGSANAAVDILVGEDSDVDMYKCNINALYKCKELLLLLLSVINIADLCHKHTHAAQGSTIHSHTNNITQDILHMKIRSKCLLPL